MLRRTNSAAPHTPSTDRPAAMRWPGSIRPALLHQRDVTTWTILDRAQELVRPCGAQQTAVNHRGMPVAADSEAALHPSAAFAAKSQ